MKSQTTKPSSTASAVTEASGAAVGAGIGLAIGGPAGALIGAASGPILTFTAKNCASAAKLFWVEFHRSMSQRKIDSDQFVECLSNDAEKTDAFYRILVAASRTIEPEKLRLLASAASGLAEQDSNAAIVTAIVMEILSELTTSHIAILSFIQTQFDTLNQKALGVIPDQIIAAFPTEEPLIRSILRKLESHGLIADNARLDRQIVGVYWEVTELGNIFLNVIKDDRDV